MNCHQTLFGRMPIKHTKTWYLENEKLKRECESCPQFVIHEELEFVFISYFEEKKIVFSLNLNFKFRK